MKKTLLTTYMFLPQIGGAQYYYYHLCKNLPQDSIFVLVSRRFDRKDEDILKQEAGFYIKYTDLHWGSFLRKWFSLLFHISREVVRHNIGILWAGEVLPTGLAVYVASRIFDIPYFVTTHGADVLNPMQKTGIRGKWKRFLVRWVLKNAAFVVANTEYTRLQVEKYSIDRDKTIVVYPCPSISPDIQNIEKDDDIQTIESLKQEGWKIVLTTARAVRRKGIDMVIQAMPYVWQERPETLYVIVGEGVYKKELVKMAEDTGHKDKIIFIDFVSDNKLAYLYSLCDVYVMIPRVVDGLVEGFGIVYLNAGLFAKPVIGSKVGGVPEAIIDFYDNNYDTATGLLVNNPQNPREIAKKILMLVKDTGMAEKFGANNKKYAEKFTYSKEAEKIRQKVESITEQANSNT